MEGAQGEAHAFLKGLQPEAGRPQADPFPYPAVGSHTGTSQAPGVPDVFCWASVGKEGKFCLSFTPTDPLGPKKAHGCL